MLEHDNSQWDLATLREAEEIKQDSQKMAKVDKYIQNQIQVLSQEKEKDDASGDTNGYKVL